jgi:hypothetical protein
LGLIQEVRSIFQRTFGGIVVEKITDSATNKTVNSCSVFATFWGVLVLTSLCFFLTQTFTEEKMEYLVDGLYIPHISHVTDDDKTLSHIFLTSPLIMGIVPNQQSGKKMECARGLKILDSTEHLYSNDVKVSEQVALILPPSGAEIWASLFFYYYFTGFCKGAWQDQVQVRRRRKHSSHG